jgi:hypothetical protein
MAEQGRVQGLEELFRREQGQRAQEQLNIQREQNARLQERDAAKLLMDQEKHNLDKQEWADQAPFRAARVKKLEQDQELDALERPEKIKQIQAQTAARETRTQIERANQLAEATLQASALALRDPALAKSHLEKAGFGDMWDPRWATSLSQEGLSKTLAYLGNELTNRSAAFQRKLTVEDVKAEAAGQRVAAQEGGRNARNAEDNAAADRRQRADLEARRTREERKAAAQQELIRTRQRVTQSRDPKTFQEAAVRLRAEAVQEQDPDIRQMKEQEAALLLEAAQSLTAQPKEDAVLKRDENGRLLFSNPAGRPNPLATANNAPTSGSAATNRPARQAGVPAGRVQIFQNGKSVGTVPESQLEEAMKQGYSTRP